MRVQDLLAGNAREIVRVKSGTPLADVMQLMAAEKVGTVLLMDDGVLQGIISERDFVRIFNEHGAAALGFPVCDLVQRRVITCSEEVTLHDVMTLMSNNGIRHLPVVRDGTVLGMVSARDVMAAQKNVLLQTVKRQKQAYNLAVQAKERAEISAQQKTEFLKRVSHELRTPLNAIIGFSSLIENQSAGPLGDPRYGEYAGEINESGSRLLDIINEILEMSRLELGEWDARREIVSLAAEIDRQLAGARDWAEERGLTISADTGRPGLGIMADRFMVREMLGHLVGNAIKFTPRGGDIRVSVEDDGSNGVCIRISDTGRGIPENMIAEVTKPFCCGRDALVHEGEGIGLGLALCDAMMTLLAGRLEIESTVDVGTTVTMRFPREARHLVSVSDNMHGFPAAAAAAG